MFSATTLGRRRNPTFGIGTGIEPMATSPPRYSPSRGRRRLCWEEQALLRGRDYFCSGVTLNRSTIDDLNYTEASMQAK